MRIFLTGGTGLVGSAIVRALLDRGDDVVVLSRNAARAQTKLPVGVEIIEGDPCYEETGWQPAVAGCDAAVSLAGEPLTTRRWDARFRQLIHDSRIDSTRLLAEAITRLSPDEKPGILIATSAVDYYGFAEFAMLDEDEYDETSTGGESFLSYLCWDWEDECSICIDAGVRVVVMRLGLILSREGDTLHKLVAPFRKGFGGRIGNGRQWTSWVHISDVVGAYLHALDTQIRGPVNVVAPQNIRNAQLAIAIGNRLGRRAWFPANAMLVRAMMGEFAEYILKGRRVVPTVLLKHGYQFRYSTIESALTELILA